MIFRSNGDISYHPWVEGNFHENNNFQLLNAYEYHNSNLEYTILYEDISERRYLYQPIY